MQNQQIGGPHRPYFSSMGMPLSRQVRFVLGCGAANRGRSRQSCRLASHRNGLFCKTARHAVTTLKNSRAARRAFRFFR
jgi:hypothetical protein